MTRGGPGPGEPGGGLLLVHAHPDDESIHTGATMARYAAEGVPVTLVTCTLGELGEVIPPELRHLAADREDRLGRYRIGELDAACAALGVTDHRFLGGPGRWRDSGMMGLPSNADPGCFWQADVDEAARELAAVIRAVRPRVMITYDDRGFYGHPDHIQAHRVAWRAFGLAAGSGPVARFYATALPRSVLAGAVRLAGPEAGPGAGPVPPPGFTEVATIGELPFGVPDGQVTTEIDATRYLDAKVAAMRAHRTQITVHEPFFALSNGVGQRILGREYYTLLAGPRGPGPAGRGAGAGREAGLAGPEAGLPGREAGLAGREADLFAGLRGAYV
ncbi:MAG TPA: N-acetyl-1-D-myo-inositol-2-amino-2-deoxy-alpha-D-glucopyranoside deacetylase [Streptosporangiaceae bacterium]|nr:N-acetyl-1-D-myo-inositol-2-amino-2-deoxy-alpha-D-glucopyranoside deacetylase [Streptosporangiaceae bacterium]